MSSGSVFNVFGSVFTVSGSVFEDTTENQKMTKKEIVSLKKLWWDVHKEDHEICKRLQLGRASPVAKSGGILSPFWENSVLAFQKLLVKAITKSSKVEKHG